MNKKVKLAIGLVALATVGYLAYRYFRKPKTVDNQSVGGDDDSKLVYDKASRIIEINHN